MLHKASVESLNDDFLSIRIATFYVGVILFVALFILLVVVFLRNLKYERFADIYWFEIAVTVCLAMSSVVGVVKVRFGVLGWDCTGAYLEGVCALRLTKHEFIRTFY